MAGGATLQGWSGRLPAELTSFIGRRAELAEIRRLFGQSRLVTLTGPGGVGKTRLAVRAAAQLRAAFDHGVCFVDLAALDEPGLLVSTICDALALPEQNAGQAIDVLTAYLADRNLLLVLDTCEHLVDACALLAELLLRTAPGLRILTTSRQPLDIVGEHTLAVVPLGRPDLSGTEPAPPCESMDLFAERAAAVVPGWRLTPRNRDAVARLCHRLDGIPLAIELATVQLRALSVERILSLLDDRILQARAQRTGLVRHQTLRAAVDWSHQLCSPRERLLWARLSVFASDFDLETAEGVCADDDLPACHIMQALAGLVSKSILVRVESDDDVRYRMLDTLRAYGAEQLDALGQTDLVWGRAVDWLVGLLRQATAELPTGAQVRWLDWFRRERFIVRSVINRALHIADDPALIDSALAVGRLCALHGMIGEARHWAKRLVETRDTTGPQWTELLALCAFLALMQHDLDAAHILLDRAAKQAGSAAGPKGLAFVHQVRGIAALYADDLDLAIATLDQASELHRRAANPDVMAKITDVFRAVACIYREDYATAIRHASEVVARGAERGEQWCRSHGLLVRGLAYWLDGDPGTALTQAREALPIKRDLDDRLGISLALELTAACMAALGEPLRAVTMLGAADRARQFTQAGLLGPPHARLRARGEHFGRRLLGEAAFDAAYQAGAACNLQDAIASALDEQPDPPSTAAAKPRRNLHPLTRREEEIAALVTEGLSNREIAQQLVISKRTADSHIEHILAKLGFSSRTQIAAWLTQHTKP